MTRLRPFLAGLLAFLIAVALPVQSVQSFGGLGRDFGHLGSVARSSTPLGKMVSSLKAAGIWDKCDVIYALAGPDRATAVKNIKSPGTFDAIEVNGPISFTAWRGFTGDGVSQRLRTQFTPSTNGVNFLRDDNSLWVWSLTDAQASVIDIGNGTAPRTNITTRNTSNVYAYGNSDASNSTFSGAVDSLGLYGSQRTISTSKTLWKNGVNIGSTATTSTGIPTAEQWLLGANSAAFSTKQQGFAAWCASLTGLEVTFYNIVRTYMISVGAVANAIPSMGDSLTFNTAYPGDLPSVSSFYPAYTASALVSLTGKQVISFNYGVAGNTTTQMLARQTSSGSLSVTPGMFAYTINGGINDPANGISNATTQSNIVTMGTNAINAGFRYVFILNLHYANYPGGDTVNTQNGSFQTVRSNQAAAYATLAGTYGSRIIFVDVFTYTKNLIIAGTYVQDDCLWHESCGDIHLNALGEQTILPGAIVSTMQSAGIIGNLNYVLKRDVDPHSNDNDPMWLAKAA